MLVLDTNHISELGYGTPAGLRLRDRLLASGEDTATTIVSVEEHCVAGSRRFIGSMDLKIACITLAHDTTLLTRNTSDFARVPGLRVANWLD